jgi:uncharacterized Zn finger protein
MIPTQLKALQAKSKALNVRIIRPEHRGDPYRAIVASDSALGHLVTIHFEAGTTHADVISADCTCPWAEHGGIGCKHVLAALTRLAELKRSSLSFWRTQEEARRQKRRTFRLTSKPANDALWVTSRPA